MSHLNTFKTDITDRDCLVKALCRMGFTRNQIEVNDKAENLRGYHGFEGQKAHVIIRQPHSQIRSDVGWEKQGETFVGHVDGYWGIYDDKWNVTLMDNYITEKKKAELEAKGLTVVETRDAMNRIQLRAKFAAPKNTGKIQTRS